MADFWLLDAKFPGFDPTFDPSHCRSEQLGHFTASQAQAAGFSRDLLTHHTRRGRFVRIRRGLYRLRDYPPQPHEEVMAAWLTVGKEGAVISHETALELLGLSDAAPDAIHLSVPRAKRHLPKLPGVIIHTTARALDQDDAVMVDGMRIASPARTIADVADAGAAPSTVERAVTQAIQRGLVTAEELSQRAAERGQRVNSLITRAVGSQPEITGGENREESSSLGGRLGRSGYRYQDFVAAEWYAKLLHPETTHVASVQNEARGFIDDIRVTFTSGSRRYQQVKEKRRLSSQDKLEILTDLIAHYRKEPGAEFELVTSAAWDALRQLAEYARHDGGNREAFLDTARHHAGRWVRDELDRVVGLCGDEVKAHAFLQRVSVRDRYPDKETIEQTTTTHCLERITGPSASAFTLLVARAYARCGSPASHDRRSHAARGCLRCGPAVQDRSPLRPAPPRVAALLR